MSKTLKSVNKLVIDVLVDNNIEWFTPMPTGFFHEVIQHVQDDPPIDELTGVPILDLENFCCGAHGLALLITTSINGEDHTILMDAGPESKSIFRNAHALKAPMDRVERILLSHWHADHSGGILKALEIINKPVIVDLHPDRPIARGISRPSPGPSQVIARLPEDPTFNAITQAGGQVETHADSHLVSNESVYVSGLIRRHTSFETGIPGGVQWVEKDSWQGWEKERGELVLDERYAAVDVKGKGLVVFSSCSHAGIVNVVQDAVERFRKPILMVIGGFHLAGRDIEDRIGPTVDYFSKLEPKVKHIVPLHCTGHKARVAFTNALGDAFVAAGVGTKIVLMGE